MTSVCLYFEVHQPYRIPEYSFFDIGQNHHYEDNKKNFFIINSVSENSYLPANKKLLQLIKKYNNNFKVAFSLSGTLIEQLEQYRPDVLASFKELAETGCVEFLNETYYRSLSYLYSKDEFLHQVEKHKKLIKTHFNQTPKVFRNHELNYNNEIASIIEDLGYEGIICDGVSKQLYGRSPNQIFKPDNSNKIKCLLKQYMLPRDAAHRFSKKGWRAFPLTLDKFSHGKYQVKENDKVINLFMNYEKPVNELDFLDYMPEVILNHPNFDFKTPSEVIKCNDTQEIYDTHGLTSWLDNKDKSHVWKSNSMQNQSLEKIYELEGLIKLLEDPILLDKWSKLLSSDHFYNMCNNANTHGKIMESDLHESPYEAYIYFMNIVSDLEKKVSMKIQKKYKKTALLTTKVA